MVVSGGVDTLASRESRGRRVRVVVGGFGSTGALHGDIAPLGCAIARTDSDDDGVFARAHEGGNVSTGQDTTGGGTLHTGRGGYGGVGRTRGGGALHKLG
jgi:hypothetical protein